MTELIEIRDKIDTISDEQLDRLFADLSRTLKTTLQNPTFNLIEQVMQIIHNLAPKPPP
jgi:hypothetical protein